MDVNMVRAVVAMRFICGVARYWWCCDVSGLV